MGTIAGVSQYQATGQVGVAVLAGGVTLAINNFATSTNSTPLKALLTINGNLEKRHIDLGPLPAGQTRFELTLPPGTDISLFNTLLICDADSDATVGKAIIA